MTRKGRLFYTQKRNRKINKFNIGLEGFFAKQNYNINVARLWRHWDIVLGDLAEDTIPLGHRDKTLVLGAEDNSLMQELFYSSQEILGLVNEFIGEEYFNKIEFQLNKGRKPLNISTIKREKYFFPREKPENLGKLEITNPYYRAIYQSYAKSF